MSGEQQIIRRKGAASVAAAQSLALFATVPLGAEQLTATELKALGASTVHAVRGGVSFGGDRRILYRSLLRLRTASRVLLQLGQFPCGSPQELYDGMRALPWGELLTPAMTLAVDCTLRDSAITHSHFAALKAKDAIVDLLRDQTAQRPNIDTKSPDLRVNLHIAKNLATVSLDAAVRRWTGGAGGWTATMLRCGRPWPQRLCCIPVGMGPSRYWTRCVDPAPCCWKGRRLLWDSRPGPGGSSA